MAFIEIKNLNFNYPNGKQALNNITLDIESGEFLLICGASGCGKSTLLRHMKPVLCPHGSTSGDVLMDGIPIREMSARAQAESIGFVMQNPEMQFVTDKVWHELAFGLESLGLENRVMRLRVAEMAGFFGVHNLFDREVCSLSGGQKQLVCLAAVMVMQPKLLLLDEPTSQLDPIAAVEFIDVLRKVNHELGTTIIITEHRLESMFPLADRVAFMRNGRIIECCKPADSVQRFRADAEIFTVLPTAMRLYAETQPKEANLNNAPITVRDGRKYLNGFMHALKSAKTGNSRSDKYGNGVKKEQIHGSETRSMGKGDKLVSIKDAWFRYEQHSEDVIRGLNLDIYSGELTCIIGSNGVGKTTAMLLAAGIYEPYRGRVKILCGGERSRSGKKVTQNNKSSNILMLPQDPKSCFVKDTVRDELESACVEHNVSRDKLVEIISLMEIETILDSHPYDISGGELQRAAIARILLLSPKLIFLDEATKGMDAFFKAKFGTILRNLTKNGTAVVLVSHDIEFCAEFSDRCILLFNGEKAVEGTPREVFLGNGFYTTAANRIARGTLDSVLLVNDIISIIKR